MHRAPHTVAMSMLARFLQIVNVAYQCYTQDIFLVEDCGKEIWDGGKMGKMA